MGSGGSSLFFDGSMGEIIITDDYPSNDDIEKIEGYLAWKWGLEDNLPTDHTYKTIPPLSS